jgi:hypothetical protein
MVEWCHYPGVDQNRNAYQGMRVIAKVVDNGQKGDQQLFLYQDIPQNAPPNLYRKYFRSKSDKIAGRRQPLD